ncbi:hypothetical protein [Arthrobacter sp. UYEF20]|uniref:hypothetical protein n=1 Tax=Arthrobacter sp. UYEF20 TaxID=1756363 RepID=UPI003392802B
MTGTREPQQDDSIQAMLRESGLEAATELRGSLEQLRALVPDQAPAPRADLAALLAAGASGDETLPAGVGSLAERRGRKRRLAVVGGAVIGAMSLGAGAVAASSEDFRQGVSHTVGVILQRPDTAPDLAPKPASPSPSNVPAAPVPTAAASASTTPTAEAAPAGPGSAGAPPASPAAAATAPAATPPAATPPAGGRGGILPYPPRRPVNPASPGVPGMPAVPGPPDGRGTPVSPLPAPPTLPDAIPTKLPGRP